MIGSNTRARLFLGALTTIVLILTVCLHYAHKTNLAMAKKIHIRNIIMMEKENARNHEKHFSKV